jgi:subtilisin family serine protease
MAKPEKSDPSEKNKIQKRSTPKKEVVSSDELSIKGFSTIAKLSAISICTVLFSFFDIFFNWAIEQSIFESSSVVPNVRWIIHGILGILLVVILLLAQLLTKTPRLKIIFKLWLLAAILSLILLPVKFLSVTDQQASASIQILTLLVLVAIFYFIEVKAGSFEFKIEKKDKSGLFGMAALIGSAMSVPWILWGALGSLDDTILYLVLGEIFAVFCVLILYPYLFDKTLAPERNPGLGDYILDGLSVMIFFFITLGGLSQNGSQLLMGIMLPFSAWVVVAFAAVGSKFKDRAKAAVGLIAGLALALPQLWFDADELSAITNSSSGETLSWATKAAYSSMGVLMIVTIVFLVFYRSSSVLKVSKKTNIGLSLFALVSVVSVYFLWGAKGFYGDKIFIVMKDQADLSSVNQITDLDARKQAVYSTLVKEADSSQADLRAQLDKWKLPYTPYYLVNGIEVDSTSFYAMQILKRNDVDRILQSPKLRPLPQQPTLSNSDHANKPSDISWNLKMIGVDKVREDLGVTGKGIIIGQNDTGADAYHSELKSSYRGSTGSDDYNWLDPWYGSIYPSDNQGHGTATLALITGKTLGIAPDAQWIGCVNLGRNLGNPAEYLNCMQFMLAPYPEKGNAFTDGDPSKGAMIVNNSWGCPQMEGCDAETFQSAVTAMEDAGIFMSVAAGNNGMFGCSTITDPPSIYQDAFTAGSINQSGNISDFSSLGPVAVDGSKRVKPDILAPGENIISAFPGNSYTQESGTSFSAPHVSGVVALMWSANPKLIGNIELTRQILEQTASPYTGIYPTCVTNQGTPNDGAGYGVLNAYEAVRAALEVK